MCGYLSFKLAKIASKVTTTPSILSMAPILRTVAKWGPLLKDFENEI